MVYRYSAATINQILDIQIIERYMCLLKLVKDNFEIYLADRKATT